MATRNTFTITIDGVNYTSHVPFPLPKCNLHDARLDECNIKILNIKRKVFKPLTTVILTESDGYDTITKRFLVASDKSDEVVIGSKRYNHEIYIIEETKYLEGIIVDTCGFNNILAKTDNGEIIVVPQVEVVPSYIEHSTPSYAYISPIEEGSQLNIVPNSVIFKDYNNKKVLNRKTKVYFNNNLIKETSSKDESFDISASVGTYKIEYYIVYETKINDPHLGSMTQFVSITATYQLQCLESASRYASKPLTLTDVINRILDIAVIQTKNKTAKFALNDNQAREFENILSPEFNFTQNNLREILQEIGSFIDSEPRLVNNIIYFDKYINNEFAKIKNNLYSYHSITQSIDQYATQLDSSVQNLVNQISYAEGAVIEPYNGGLISVRTENVNARIEDNESLIIPTSKPIYDIVKVECGYSYNGKVVGDITSYIYEESEYSLSDPYEENGRGNKIYFKQNEKNIKGLTFQILTLPISVKVGDTTVNKFLYSIQRIIALKLQISNQIAVNIDVSKLTFKITYIPFYNTRLVLTKPNIAQIGKRRSLNYNQSANIIETKYYGRQIANAISRIGNIELIYSYIIRRLKDIPKSGQLFDNNYVISVVTIETNPDYYKVTIGLSRRYTNISTYVGINSQKRYAEISERQALDRNITYTDYAIFSNAENKIEETLVSNDVLVSIRNSLTGIYDDIGINDNYKITCVETWGENEQGEDIGSYNLLPVVSSAFSRCINLSFSFEDNYSAGQQAVFKQGEVKGVFTKQCPYTDKYGRLEYLNVNFNNTLLNKSSLGGGGGEIIIPPITTLSLDPVQTVDKDTSNDSNLAFKLPQINKPSVEGIISTGIDGSKALRIKKMGNERILFNYNLEFVTDDDNYIIGDNLASANPLVVDKNVKSNGASMYILNRFISPFDRKIEITEEDVLQADFSKQDAIPGYVYVRNNKINFMRQFAKSSGKSWVVIDRVSGGLFFGCNMEICVGDEINIKPIIFAHEIFD